jgi:hypothetical protein
LSGAVAVGVAKGELDPNKQMEDLTNKIKGDVKDLRVDDITSSS